MLKRLLVYMLLLVGLNLAGQNLVQNAGFEEYVNCPELPNCDVAMLPHWQWSTSVQGYNNLCNFSVNEPLACAAPFSVIDQGCFQYPQEGDGYTCVELNIYPIFSYRNFLQTQLLKPLDSAKCYYFSMYINLCDSCIAATDDIGVLFTQQHVVLNPQPQASFPEPQIVHYGDFIQDKINWVKYEGIFTATGGEKFMTIGSFSPTDSINYILLPNSSQYSNKASYLIDNITLIECSAIGIIEKPVPAVHIYPNPATNTVSISLPTNYPNPQLYIYNLTGQLVATKPVQPNQPVPITELNAGIYIFAIQSNNTLIGREKVVVY